MTEPKQDSEDSMTLLEHLDELRKRLFKAIIAFLVAFIGCWAVSGPILQFLMLPIRRHLFEGGDIVFINLTEPFVIYMKASAVAAIFISSPFLLYQLWAFIAPGLHKHERRWVVPFLTAGSLFFVAGGAFGYYVATPIAARWLIQLGGDFMPQITLRSAFSFEAWIILGMGAVFEMPIVILFLSRLGVVTPGLLLRHFRLAVLLMALLSAVLTPTGDMLTMSIFAGPMILLYLLGVGVSWLFGRRDGRKES